MPPEEPGDEGAIGPPPHPLDRPWIHPTEMFARARAVPAPQRAAAPRGREVALTLAAGLTGALMMVLVLAAAGLLGSSDTTARVVSANRPADPDAAARITASANRSVAALVAVTPTGDLPGSGICVRDGQILTTSTALAGATTVWVVSADGDQHAATILGRDDATGLVLLRANETGLEPAPMAADGSVRVGAWVLALGSSDNSSPWVTTGVVASMGGWADDGTGVAKPGLITTSASMPNGARGGALVDRDGRVVGILAGSPSGTNGGLATPVSVLRSVATQLAETGHATHGALGVRAETASPRGARVTEVFLGTGAAAAGLRTGDVITNLDGTPIRDTAGLVAAVRDRLPGDRVTLDLVRGRRDLQIMAPLGSMDAPVPPAGAGLATPVSLG